MKKNKIVFFTVLLSSLLIFLIFLCTEIFMRIQGYVPGHINSQTDFVEGDSLKLNPCYTADSNGIMKFSPMAQKVINDCIKESLTQQRLCFNDTIKQILKEDLVYAYCSREKSPIFSSWADSIRKTPKTDSLTRLFRKYVEAPINQDGFRSVAFQPSISQVKKVLLIGDSFTYGFSADPITESFADHLLMQGGLLVYNTGITSTDPVQYLAILKAYMSILKPDIVVVSFYMGNDILNYRRESKPYQFAMYPINNKFVLADPFGSYLPPAEANKVMRLSNIVPNQKSNYLNKFLAKTVLGTRLWIILRNLGLVNPNEIELQRYYNPQLNAEDPEKITKALAKEIFDFVQERNCKILFVVIADKEETNPWNKKFNAKKLFEGLPVVFAPDSSNWYAAYPDGHFNNHGHLMYSRWLRSKIDVL